VVDHSTRGWSKSTAAAPVTTYNLWNSREADIMTNTFNAWQSQWAQDSQPDLVSETNGVPVAADATAVTHVLASLKASDKSASGGAPSATTFDLAVAPAIASNGSSTALARDSISAVIDANAGSAANSSAATLGSVSAIGSYIANSSPTSANGHHFNSGTITVNLTGLALAGELSYARAALAAWSQVANITFVETSGAAQITMSDDANNTTYDAYTTGASWGSNGVLNPNSIHISQYWYNHNGGAQGAVNTLNSYAYQTYVHEIGHALGLGHVGPYNGSATYGIDNIFTNDSWQYSVMSYFSQNSFGGASYAYVTSAMQADIYGIQLLYGTPLARNHWFGYGPTTGAAFDLAVVNSFTMYNPDGTANLDASQYTGAQTVKFDAGSFSSIKGLTNNVGLATNTHLTTYWGGSGADTIDFGSVANGNRSALGNAGADYFKNTTSSASSSATITADGGSGVDIFDNATTRANVTFKHTNQSSNGWFVTGIYDYDYLSNIEIFRSTDVDTTLRQARSNFNFGSVTNDYGSTSDLLLLDTNGYVIDWTIQNKAFAAGSLIGGSAGWTVFTTGDFNADGVADILMRNNTNNQVSNWTVQNGQFLGSNLVSGDASGWGLVGTGDVNNDGASDVIMQRTDGMVGVWVMTGGVPTGVAIGLATGYTAAAIGDFNGDGTADVLLRNNATGQLVGWMMNNGAIQSGTSVANGAGLTVAGAGDFDANGTTDILLRDGANNLYTLMMQNGVAIGSHLIGNVGSSAVVGTGDYNGDGTADIALQNGSMLNIFQINNGLFVSNTLVSSGIGGYSVIG
jgi:serralysin